MAWQGKGVSRSKQVWSGTALGPHHLTAYAIKLPSADAIHTKNPNGVKKVRPMGGKQMQSYSNGYILMHVCTVEEL